QLPQERLAQHLRTSRCRSAGARRPQHSVRSATARCGLRPPGCPATTPKPKPRSPSGPRRVRPATPQRANRRSAAAGPGGAEVVPGSSGLGLSLPPSQDLLAAMLRGKGPRRIRRDAERRKGLPVLRRSAEDVGRAAEDERRVDVRRLDAGERGVLEVRLDVIPALEPARRGTLVRAEALEARDRDDVALPGAAAGDPLELAQLLE